MSTVVSHPLAVDTSVEFTKPICPCKGGGYELAVGRILKIINNQSGIWYYLDVGVTVRADRIQRVIRTPTTKK